MITLLAVIFVFGILIFVHELGHFLMAKLVGIKVERFSLGFPPRMIGKKIGDTDYCISWIPLGGYVKLAGMIDESLDKNAIKGEPWEFQSKPIPIRFLAVIAGPVMNLLLAIFLFSVLTFYTGIPKLEGPVVGEVESGKPAALAGLQAGDKILAIDGKRIQTWDEVVQIIHNSPEGKDLQIDWIREGQKYSITVKPYFDKELKVNRIGMTPKYGVEKLGLFASVKHGLDFSWYLTKEIALALKRIFVGELPVKDALAGPVGIVKMAGESARRGFDVLLYFTGMLSLNLALLNILPIPVLDGGHLVYLAIETVIRRPIPVKAKMIIQQIGMALLLALIVFIIINDIRRFW